MFLDEMEQIDRAMSVDAPFARYLRSPRVDNRNIWVEKLEFDDPAHPLFTRSRHDRNRPRRKDDK